MRNVVELIGFLGSDPEIRVTPNGKEIARLIIATSRTVKNKETGEYKSETTWHNNVMALGNKVNAAKHLKKGSKVFIQGRLQYSESTEEQGKKNYFTNIVIEELLFLDSKPDNHSPQTETHQDDQFSSDDYAF